MMRTTMRTTMMNIITNTFKIPNNFLYKIMEQIKPATLKELIKKEPSLRKPNVTKYPHVPDRTQLVEGIKKGIAWNFIEYDEANDIKMISPSSACKDYLSDVIYIENKYPGYTIYQKQTIFGYSHKYTGAFDNDDTHVYLLMTPSFCKSFDSYKRYNDPVKAYQDWMYPLWKRMSSDVEETLTQINDIENRLGIESKTYVKEFIDPSNMRDAQTPFGTVVAVPKYWVKSTARISLYVLLLRSIIINGNFDKNGSRMISIPGFGSLHYTLLNIKHYINHIFQKPELLNRQHLPMYRNLSSIHNHGWQNYYAGYVRPKFGDSKAWTSLRKEYYDNLSYGGSYDKLPRKFAYRTVKIKD